MAPDDFPALLLDEALSAFEDMLQCARLVHGKPRPDNCEDRNQEQKDQHLHGRGVSNRGLRVVWLNVQGSQQGGDRAAEQVVQDLSQPELFRHLRSVAS